VAWEIPDLDPKDRVDTVRALYKDVLGDPVGWAGFVVKEHGARMICLNLRGTHPDRENRSDGEAAKLVKAFYQGIQAKIGGVDQTPLRGCPSHLFQIRRPDANHSLQTDKRGNLKYPDVKISHVVIPGSVEEERVNRLMRRIKHLCKEKLWPGDYVEEKLFKGLIGGGASYHLSEARGSLD